MRKLTIILGLLLSALVTQAQSGVTTVGPVTINGGATLGGTAYAALGYVQDTATHSGSAPTYTTAYTTQNNTAGNTSCLAFTFAAVTGTASVSSIISANNTYTLVSGSSVSVAATHYANIYSQIWCATGIVGSVKDSLTITMSFSATGFLLGTELIEVGSGGVVDQAVAASGTGTSISAGSITTPSNGAFGIAIFESDDGLGHGPGWFTAGSGWTIAALNNGGGSQESGAQYQAQATAGSITGNATSIHGTPAQWVASMVTIRTH
jgi:hypothetical protein